MVFCGLYPIDGDELPELRDALEKLRLNDSSFTYEPESSQALGFGFRCGFLGLLHMEIVRERLEREFDLSLIASAPSVAYVACLTDGTTLKFDNPSEMPDPVAHRPHRRAGAAGDVDPSRRVHRTGHGAVPVAARASSTGWSTCRPSGSSSSTACRSPRSSSGFFDLLKSRTKGYASLDYEPSGMITSNLAKVDVLVNHIPVDAFSTVVHRSQADDYGRRMTAKLRELIPRQLFDVPIQAAVGGRIIASETVKAKRKDVLAKCYGGDITRKRKLLERQKEGKKKMKAIGRVEVPQEAFISALRLEE